MTTVIPAATPIALTIAGSDSSGGAGIQADLKTFTAFGVYGASVITALTAQNTQGVRSFETVSPAFVVAQMDAVLEDLEVGAIKTGMLATAEIVTAASRRLAAGPRAPLVVDPVMVATSGDALSSCRSQRLSRRTCRRQRACSKRRSRPRMPRWLPRPRRCTRSAAGRC
jgi:hydroxymethylpyrimidine/phosphomethylpyrimidine kinase